MKNLINSAVIYTSISASDVNHYQQNISQRLKKLFPNLSEIELRSELFKQAKIVENFMPLQRSAFFCIKTKTVKDIELVVTTSDKPLMFDQDNKLEANMVFILLCPMNEGPRHLNILARLTRLVRSEDFYNTMIGAETPDALRAMLLSKTEQIMAA